jgi:hypothetical protein
MALPHYNQDQTSRKGRNFEPVQSNLFEVTILPPQGVSDAPLMLQHVNSISGLELYKDVSAVEQKYKFVTRSFAGLPESTTVDVTINFSLNLNEANQAYLYKSIRQWYNLRYDPNTGAMGLKKDYVGTIVVVQFNRAGDIYRTITLEDCQITSGVGFTAELNYTETEAATLEVIWRCDAWKEVLA